MNPGFDFHAIAPEIILSATIVVVLIADFFFEYRARGSRRSQLATIGVLAALVPVVTLAVDGADRVDVRRRVRRRPVLARAQGLLPRRRLRHAAAVGRLHRRRRLLPGRVLRPAAHARCSAWSSWPRRATSSRSSWRSRRSRSRRSCSPGWRKHDTKSNEAAIKYYLIGVLSSAVMLYGMSLIFGLTGSTLLSDIARRTPPATTSPRCSRSRSSSRSSGSRSRSARCRSTSGRPTPTRARPPRSPRSSRSRRRPAASSRCSAIIFFGFFAVARQLATDPLGARGRVDDAREPRRAAPDEHRPHAGLLVDRAGRVHPRAVRGRGRRDAATQSAFEAVVIYLLIYGAMNLGAFAVVIAFARRTRSAEISSYGGPRAVRAGLAVLMSRVPVLARRDPAARGLVRQVRDVPRGARRGHARALRARRDRRGELGDRVLLLRAGRPEDVVPPGPRSRASRPRSRPTPLALGIALDICRR